MRTIGSSDLSVFPLCLGSNIFGWTIDEAQSFAVLDAYAAAGGNFIDTADSYSAWITGNRGGESETIIGNWMAARGNRDDIVVATKVGKSPGLEGLAPATIRRAAEDSLARLRTDRIDLYYAHMDDDGTPLEEALGAFGELIREGKVRHIAASNYTAPRLAEALDLARGGELPSYVAIQPHYNLDAPRGVRGRARPSCARARAWPAFRTSRWRAASSPASTASAARTRDRRAPAPRAATSTSAASRCWRCSTSSPQPTRRPSPRSRSRGWPPSPRWRHRSRAPGRPSSSPSCCRWHRLELSGDELQRLSAASG